MAHALISPAALQARLAAGENLVLIDVRSPAEHRSIHAVGVRLMPLPTFDPAAVIAGLPAGTTEVFLFCHGGARAREAADRLAAAGCTSAVVVDGGTKAWDAAGLPVVRGQGGGLSVERQTQLVIGVMVATGAALAAFVHPWWAALPGAIGLGLMNAGLSGRCPLAIVIAAMPWNRGSSCTSCAAPAPVSKA